MQKDATFFSLPDGIPFTIDKKRFKIPVNGLMLFNLLIMDCFDTFQLTVFYSMLGVRFFEILL